jgi:hypothetical protein
MISRPNAVLLRSPTLLSNPTCLSEQVCGLFLAVEVAMTPLSDCTKLHHGSTNTRAWSAAIGHGRHSIR